MFAAIAFFGGLFIHYQASQVSTREAIMEIKGDIKVLNVRVDNIEGKKKPYAQTTWEEDKLAVMPQGVKIGRNERTENN